MQKKLLALAVAGAVVSSPALAQSNVTIYGSIDMGFAHRSNHVLSGVSSKNSIDSGQSAGDRLGFRGSEDLGNGAQMLFVLEAGFSSDDGKPLHGGRQLYLGFANEYGTVMAGRLYTPHYTLLSKIDPFEAGMLGNYQNTHRLGTIGLLAQDEVTLPEYGDVDMLGANLFDPERVDNAIAYVSPNWNGFSLTAAYSMNAIGQEGQGLFGSTDGGNDGDLRVIALMPRYTQGPLDIGLSFHQMRASSVNLLRLGGTQMLLGDLGHIDPKITNWTVGGSYDFGLIAGDLGLKLSAFYDHNVFDLDLGRMDSEVKDIKQKSWMIGATMPFGRHTFLVSYNRTKLEDDPLLSMQNADSVEASQWALGYRYAITKRTSFYAAYARISQDSELEDGDAATMASYGVTGLAASLGDAGNGGGGYQSGFQFGLKHVF